MLRAAAAFDFRQHFIDDDIFRDCLAERCIQSLQQVRHGFIVAAHECDTNLLAFRSQRCTSDGRYLADRYLTARVVEKGLDMLEGCNR